MKRSGLFTLALVGLLAVTAQSQTVSVLYNFGSKTDDPLDPGYQGIIAQGRNGNLYSTTSNGGTSADTREWPFVSVIAPDSEGVKRIRNVAQPRPLTKCGWGTNPSPLSYPPYIDGVVWIGEENNTPLPLK